MWLDADDPHDVVLAEVKNSPHRQFLVSRASIDDVLGVARKEDILQRELDGGKFDLTQVLRAPVPVHAGASVLDVLNRFKTLPLEMVLVVDEHGGLQGIVTQTDLLETTAGDLPDSEATAPEVQELEGGALRIDGAMSIYDARERLGLEELPEGEFNTLAGMVLSLFGRIPNVGDATEWNGWTFEVAAVDKWRIGAVVARRQVASPVPEKRKGS